MDPISSTVTVIASYLAEKAKDSKREFSLAAWEWIRPLFLKKEDEIEIALLLDDKEIIISNKDDIETSTLELTRKIQEFIKEKPEFGSYLVNQIDVIYDEYLLKSKASTKNNIDSSKKIFDSIELIEKL